MSILKVVHAMKAIFSTGTSNKVMPQVWRNVQNARRSAMESKGKLERTPSPTTRNARTHLPAKSLWVTRQAIRVRPRYAIMNSFQLMVQNVSRRRLSLCRQRRKEGTLQWARLAVGSRGDV